MLGRVKAVLQCQLAELLDDLEVVAPEAGQQASNAHALQQDDSPQIELSIDLSL